MARQLCSEESLAVPPTGLPVTDMWVVVAPGDPLVQVVHLYLYTWIYVDAEPTDLMLRAFDTENDRLCLDMNSSTGNIDVADSRELAEQVEFTSIVLDCTLFTGPQIFERPFDLARAAHHVSH